MAKCDLCNKPCPPHEMKQLLDIYRLNNITDVCTACADWADNKKSEMQKEIAPKMREAIELRASVYNQWKPKTFIQKFKYLFDWGK